MRNFCIVAILVCATTVQAQFQSQCQPTSQQAALAACPCGPDWIQGGNRELIPQEWYGADFHAACRKHDACVRIPGQSRSTCDRQFFQDLRSECKYSTQPQECRRITRAMYVVARVFGGRELSPRTKAWGINTLRRVNVSYGKNPYPRIRSTAQNYLTANYTPFSHATVADSSPVYYPATTFTCQPVQSVAFTSY